MTQTMNHESSYATDDGLGLITGIIGAVGNVSSAVSGADRAEIRAQNRITEAQLKMAELSAGNTRYIVGGLIASTLIGGSVYAFIRRKKARK